MFNSFAEVILGLYADSTGIIFTPKIGEMVAFKSFAKMLPWRGPLMARVKGNAIWRPWPTPTAGWVAGGLCLLQCLVAYA